jgi:sensor c-di-GMP phosphodiesterase-like protein
MGTCRENFTLFRHPLERLAFAIGAKIRTLSYWRPVSCANGNANEFPLKVLAVRRRSRCGAVEWRSQASNVLSFSRAARLSAPTDAEAQKCRTIARRCGHISEILYIRRHRICSVWTLVVGQGGIPGLAGLGIQGKNLYKSIS